LGENYNHNKILAYFRSPEEKQGCKFFCFCSPPLGTIGESIAAIRRFHSLRSFHLRLLKVGPLRGPDVICETRVLYKAFAPSGRRAKCDDTQGDALGYELLPLQGVGAILAPSAPSRRGGLSLLLLPLQGVWGNRNYINCCIWLSVNPVISITVAASMPFASIFLAISILLWLLPTSSPFAMPCFMPFSMPC
jgi:hypothetical protein